MSASDIAPAPPAGRIGALDLLRGVAILGTFVPNVWLFAHPGWPLGFLQDAFATASGVAGQVEIGLRRFDRGPLELVMHRVYGIGRIRVL